MSNYCIWILREMFGVVHAECVSTKCARAEHERKNVYAAVMDQAIDLANQNCRNPVNLICDN